MARSIHKCQGGAKLTTIGACWFVSYLYYNEIDRDHICWQKLKSCSSRKSTFRGTVQYHSIWLEFVRNTSDRKLNTNQFGLTASEVKSMVNILLNKRK